MADKIIKLKIDVTKINKEWLFQGEKGVYLDCTLLYNEEDDKFGNCGMVVQDVPSAIYKADNTLKGSILGNGKVFKNTASRAVTPGVESGKLGVKADLDDDLPF